jgi:hypothetical protein
MSGQANTAATPQAMSDAVRKRERYRMSWPVMAGIGSHPSASL